MPAMALDDVRGMNELTESTKAWFETDECRREMNCLQHSLLASSFYVVLLEKKQSSTGIISARLTIACRWEDDEETKHALRQILCNSYFHIHSMAGEFDTVRMAFQTPLSCEVKIKNFYEPIDIRLVSENQLSKSISGFPAPISKIIYLQIPNKIQCRPPKRTAQGHHRQASKRVCLSLGSPSAKGRFLHGATVQSISTPRAQSMSLVPANDELNGKTKSPRQEGLVSCSQNFRTTQTAVALLGVGSIFYYLNARRMNSQEQRRDP
ncbi:hypothetical protein N7513_003188 [Penicillium frequentans]|uniref:Uncharacterized protein n=1 Tax=Penicillium frequentans TaxID=3151616 RepID=A0AAD6CHI1_9EURO|nr:hypothetical protein N7494_013301 [Penicillium glabrum]KAJ5557602.1 hypothetical protein N7513_003188 [Penicillium glabrum]